MAGLALAAMLIAAGTCAAEGDPNVSHNRVYSVAGRFGGWPANHGIWAWGDEILVGFSAGYYKDQGPTRHHIDHDKPEEHLLARSLDGGETWTIEDPAAQGDLLPRGESLHGVELDGVELPELAQCPGGIDFTRPDFAMTIRMDNVDAGVSRFSYSYNRGHTWEGPYRLPNFGTPGIAARTDYIVDGASTCTLFLTAAKEDGEEGRPLCARTTDGGATWNLVSLIGPEPKGFAIMPASARLSDTDLYVVLRERRRSRRWLSAYGSADNGKTWRSMPDPVDSCGEGNPPSLVKLRDGRLCLIYGYRADPFNICAKLSGDGGQTWSEEIVLRGNGRCRDIGYPRSVQRPDGKVVTTYYWCDPGDNPDRYIGATIWDPGPAE